MGNESQVLGELRELVLGVVPTATIASEEDSDRPLNEIGVDSLDTMSVLLDAQEKFGVEIPDEVVGQLSSLRAIARYVAERQG